VDEVVAAATVLFVEIKENYEMTTETSDWWKRRLKKITQ
jgi:hypothetical protein